MAKDRTDDRPIKAYVNARIRETAVELTLEPGEAWGFFCECDSPDCREIVYLALADYELLRDGRGSVLAQGHRDAKRRAKRLQEESAALRGEALHASARAAKALARAKGLTGRTVYLCANCRWGGFAEAPADRCPMCGGSEWRVP